MNARHLVPRLLLATAACGLASCEDDPWPVDGERAEGTTASPGDGWTRPAPIGMAIVNSDRKSVSISLVAPGTAAVSNDGCFGSGSADPKLSAALSGDVVLPSATQPGNELVIIDRTNSVLTWLDPATCQVRRQLNVGGGSGEGFAANPYDLAAGLGGAKGYVTRYNRNSKDPAEGSDVLVIDTQRPAMIGRIDLRMHATESDTPGKTILPYPTRMAVVGKKVYVALNNLSEAYDAAGTGRIAVIDATRDAVEGSIDVPPLKNCGTITLVTLSGGATGLAVGCAGAYSDKERQIEGAGVGVIDVSKTPAEVKVIPSRPFGRPISGFDLAALETGEAFTVVSGEGMTANDAVWAFGLGGTAPTKIFEAGGAYVLSLALDRGRRTLYLLDAAPMNPRVHVLSLPAGGAPMQVGSFVASPKTGLPPRQLGFY